ncbi:MAG: hypothetical protein JRH20_16835 [Deltaproteobacteria bacterium]|nr:hypothetical protein [Deltaproteobacteria bacterium]
MCKSAYIKPLLVLAVLFFLPACGDDASPANDTGTNPDTVATQDTGATVDVAPTDDSTVSQDAGVVADTAAVADIAMGTCSVWEITYDLAGSEFEIKNTPMGAGDQLNTVATPYDADDHVGPGTITLRFQDLNNAPGGLAAITEYAMGINFIIGGVSKVTTEMDMTAGPSACGVTTGTLNGATVAWSPAALVDTHAVGSILCEGVACVLGGMPDGQPTAVDEVADQALGDFVFAEGLGSFTMAATVVSQDNLSTVTWRYKATETARELVPGPACLCP